MSESRPRFFFINSSKHQRQNAEQTPASKSCLNFNFKILTKPCAQSLNRSLAFWPSLSFQICNKLLPTRSSSSTSATVTTSTSFKLASSHARVTSIKSTKQDRVRRQWSLWKNNMMAHQWQVWLHDQPIFNQDGDLSSLIECYLQVIVYIESKKSKYRAK